MTKARPHIEASARLSHPVIHTGGPALVFLRIDVTATGGEDGAPPLDLAVVLDRSGSMHGPGLAYAKDAVGLLIDRLRTEDGLALAVYDDTVDVIFPLSKVDPPVMRAHLERITSGATTNLSGGLVQGLQELENGREDGIRRVLLLSDGLANEGVTDTAGLQRITERYGSDGRTVSTFGLGASYDEHLLTAIADTGGGTYYYISSPEDIPGIFHEELGELGTVVAQNMTVDFDPGECQVAGVLGFAGGGLPAAAGDVQTGAARSVILALEVSPAGAGDVELGTVATTWTPLYENSLTPVSRKITVQALASHDIGKVEERIDHDVLRAAQLQLAADEHRAATDAARRGDEEEFRDRMSRAEATLATVEPGDDPHYDAQMQLHEELRSEGAGSIREDRDLQLRSHRAQYTSRRTRRPDPPPRSTRRPAAIEDRHLRPWGNLSVPVPPRSPALRPGGSPPLEDRIRGMLLGLAIGDSLGNTTEGMLPADRLAQYGEVRDYPPNRHADGRLVGVPSDDTQLAFWTVESLLQKGRLDPEDLASAFSSRRIFGIGSSVRSFLRRRKKEGKAWHEAGVASAGNGALMRIAPVVLPHLRAPAPDMWRDVIAATLVTHRDEAAVAANVGFVGLLFECLAHGEGDVPSGRWWPDTFLRYARAVETGETYTPRSSQIAFEGTLCDFVEAEMVPAVEEQRAVLEMQSRWYSGAYLLETMPCVLQILALHGGNPEEALIRAVNDTKDNDTIAAAVGAAVGALHGEAALPARWRKGLTGRLGEDDDFAVHDLVGRAVATWGRR